ncbi:hypothetical protein GCM10010507_37540 [Streptomyces cinnamoneus]|uniref:Uncharacterized protein n=1 Tax=Streptomyces cinnamoneus TaxID=53446 RepID=A0A918WLU1_STRCJ|nr:hypothetical protein GCM10010507_37540 [Streptomyces cinnamoneus]
MQPATAYGHFLGLLVFRGVVVLAGPAGTVRGLAALGTVPPGVGARVKGAFETGR